MAIIKIDGFDLYTYTRVAPGEGLDMADTDFLEPQFGDSAAGAGTPLLNVTRSNREVTIPVHLRSATGKDGLHALISDMNRRLMSANVLEWKDDGATNSSFLDIEFGRFEPEFNKRRQDAGWQSGIVRLFTRPFARRVASGYFTTWTASQGVVGIMGSIAIATYNGDAPGQFQFNITSPSTFPLGDGRIVGAALVPSGYIADWSAASLIRLNNATLMGNANAAGSQVVAQGFYATSGLHQTVHPDMVRLILTSASPYAGRNRVLMVAACDKPQVGFAMYDESGIPGFPCAASVQGEAGGFGVVDLGVVNIDPRLSATKTLTFSVIDTSPLANLARPFKFHQSFGDLATNNFAKINRIILLPEDTTTLAIDAQRRVIGGHGERPFPSGVIPLVIDDFGNSYSSATEVASFGLTFGGNYQSRTAGIYVASAGTGRKGGAMEIKIPTTYNLTCQGLFGLSMGGDALQPIASYNNAVIGKFIRDTESTKFVGGRVVSLPSTTPTQGILQIVVGDAGIKNFASVGAIACSILPLGIAGSSWDGNGDTPILMKVWQRGPAIDVQVINGSNGSYIATLSASHADANKPGTGLIGLNSGFGDITNFGDKIYKYSFSEQASAGHLPGDVYVFDGDERFSSRGINTKFALNFAMRGPIAQRSIVASKYCAAVVVNLPLDGGPANQSWSFGVAENEYFTYSVV